ATVLVGTVGGVAWHTLNHAPVCVSPAVKNIGLENGQICVSPDFGAQESAFDRSAHGIAVYAVQNIRDLASASNHVYNAHPDQPPPGPLSQNGQLKVVS